MSHKIRVMQKALQKNGELRNADRPVILIIDDKTGQKESCHEVDLLDKEGNVVASLVYQDYHSVFLQTHCDIVPRRW